MKKIVLYSPALSTLNLGDRIIFDSCLKTIKSLYPNAFLVSISTHLPVSCSYMRLLMDADLRFVCGSNLMDFRNFPFKQWDISIAKSMLIGPTILLGVGWRQYQARTNLYSRLLYRSVLSRDYVHSVRDGYTEKRLRAIGFDNVITTSCPTMWSLGAPHCRSIPRHKVESVVFTLTDYSRDREADRALVDILRKHYERLHFWVQGYNDLSYFRSLGIGYIDDIEVIPPSLEEYDHLLDSAQSIDYVGTRLHGGIRALQKKRRAIIIGVDNRAEEKRRDFGLSVVSRGDAVGLRKAIQSEYATDIRLPEEAIRRWIGQFRG